MDKESQNSKMLKLAYQKGYRVQDNKVVNASGQELKTNKNKAGYLRFGIKVPKTRSSRGIFLHQLLAYQLYGEEVFNHECVRHLDGNPTNNYPDNIKLGSHKDNMLDIPKVVRSIKANKATSFVRRRDWKEIEEDRFINGLSYRQLHNKYGISKGTLSYHFTKTNAPQEFKKTI